MGAVAVIVVCFRLIADKILKTGDPSGKIGMGINPGVEYGDSDPFPGNFSRPYGRRLDCRRGDVQTRLYRRVEPNLFDAFVVEKLLQGLGIDLRCEGIDQGQLAPYFTA